MNNVILKLSGEVLKGRQDSGIDYDKLLVFAKDIKEAWLLNKYNITNYNFDLIYGLPKQTVSIVRSDLEQVLSLNPKHISYYSLILEEENPNVR